VCELDYWNGTVLNVAHGMIPVCMEFMHVLLQRPVVDSNRALQREICGRFHDFD
jgi:hypothetical protein